MRYAAREKQEIMSTVESSSLGIARTLRQLSIPKSTFYHWYNRYLTGGIEGLQDKGLTPPASWNQVSGEERQTLLDMTLDLPSLPPRELAVRLSDERQYFISEATAYRILKVHDLVTSLTWIVLKAADRFEQPTTAINQLWQTDFTYLKVTGWG